MLRKMSYGIFIIVFVTILVWIIGAVSVSTAQSQSLNVNLLKISGELLYKVKTEEPTTSIEQELYTYTTSNLIEGLSNDNARKAFWINIYNAYYQILVSRHNLKVPKIFSEKAIHFADKSFSLDDIEHGILRKFRWKYSLGYLPQFLPSKTIKQLAVTEIDYRIHFALNCGAKSCPPIAFYNYEKIDEQLDMATGSFLKSETEFDDQNKIVYLTKIMQWFKADFGGEARIREILKTVFNRDFKQYSITFKEYDWASELKNFADADKHIILQSVITCPYCDFAKEETMPTDACRISYQCSNCKFTMHPINQDCCVFCSYGSVKCPPEQ